MQILRVENLKELANYEKMKRKEYLDQLKNVTGISKAQIGRLIGLSAKTIEREMK